MTYSIPAGLAENFTSEANYELSVTDKEWAGKAYPTYTDPKLGVTVRINPGSQPTRAMLISTVAANSAVKNLTRAGEPGNRYELQPGDKILQVNTTAVTSQETYKAAVANLRGLVRLKVESVNTQKVFDLEATVR